MQKSFSQHLSAVLPATLKSSAFLNASLRVASRGLAAAGLKKIVYGNEAEIVSDVLKDRGVHSTAREITVFQEECRGLFEAERQQLFWSPRELILYALIRILRPEAVVETGCAWGGSAAFLLAALDKNDSGTLFSIDLPASETIQMKEMGITRSQIGALIPEDLKKRWRLIVGDARVELPKLLASQSADIFIHDSLHTTSHQAFEYETARTLTREGAVIASDDIRWNASFITFLKLHGLRGYAPLSDKNFGITVNRFSPYEKLNGLYAGAPPHA